VLLTRIQAYHLTFLLDSLSESSVWDDIRLALLVKVNEVPDAVDLDVAVVVPVSPRCSIVNRPRRYTWSFDDAGRCVTGGDGISCEFPGVRSKRSWRKMWPCDCRLGLAKQKQFSINILTQQSIRYNYYTHTCFVQSSNLQVTPHNFKRAHEELSNFWTKLNPNANLSLIVTLTVPNLCSTTWNPSFLAVSLQMT